MSLPNIEEQLYRQYHGLNKEGKDGKRPPLPRFFMEPKTHRLLTTAKEEKCLDALAPLYKNSDGKWIAVKSTGLDLAIPPVLLEDGFMDGFKYAKSHIDTAEGGVYDPPTRVAIHDYLQAGQVEVAVLGGMARQYQSKHQGRVYTPDDHMKVAGFFEDAPSQDALDFFMSMNWAWWYLVHYGRIASILLALALLFRLLKYLIGVLTRLCSIPKTPSSLIHVSRAFFPELTDFIMTGKYRPNGPRGPFREVVAACASGRDLATPDHSDDEEVERFRRQKLRRQGRRERKKQTQYARDRVLAMEMEETTYRGYQLGEGSDAEGSTNDPLYPVKGLERAKQEQQRTTREGASRVAGTSSLTQEPIYSVPRSQQQQQLQQQQQQQQHLHQAAVGRSGAEQLNVSMSLDQYK